MKDRTNCYFLIVLFLVSIHAFSQDESEYESSYEGEDSSEYDENGERNKVLLCTSTLKADEFIEKNTDVVSLSVESFDYLKVTNVYKGKYVPDQVIREVDTGEWSNERFKPQLTENYWGIKKNDNQSSIRIDPQNCFPLERKSEFEAALSKYQKKSKSPLFLAAQSFNSKESSVLIQKKLFFDKSKKPDWEAFDLLAKTFPDLAVLMLKNGFPPQEKETGNSALFSAIQFNSPEIALEALKNKAQIEFVSRGGDATPLLLAVIYGNARIVEALINEGAKVDSIALCFITGHPAIKDEYYADTLPDRIKITKLLLKAKADVNVSCNGSTVLAKLDGIHLPILEIFLDAGLKLDPKSKYDEPFLLSIWKRNPGFSKTTKESYEELKKSVENGTIAEDRDHLAKALTESVNFGDLEFFKLVINGLKPQIQFQYKFKDYKRCSTDVLRSATDPRFVEYALKSGLRPHFDCDNAGFTGNYPFVLELIKTCNLNSLKLFSDTDLSRTIVPDETVHEMFDRQASAASNQYHCLETLKFLKSKGNGLRSEILLQKFVQSNNFAAIKTILSSGLLTKESIHSFDAQSSGINDKTLSFFKSQIPSAKTRVAVTVNSLKLEFKKGSQYPLCAYEEDLKTSVGQRKTQKILLTCKQLTPDNITYFQIQEMDDQKIIGLVVSPHKDHHSEARFLFGETVTLEKKHIAAAEFLKTPKGNIPVTRLGVAKVRLEKEHFVTEGRYDICHRAKKVELPANINIERLHKIEADEECLNNPN